MRIASLRSEFVAGMLLAACACAEYGDSENPEASMDLVVQELSPYADLGVKWEGESCEPWRELDGTLWFCPGHFQLPCRMVVALVPRSFHDFCVLQCEPYFIWRAADLLWSTPPFTYFTIPQHYEYAAIDCYRLD